MKNIEGKESENSLQTISLSWLRSKNVGQSSLESTERTKKLRNFMKVSVS